jgi:3-hydroxybutyryl-CoA dehydrogenase
MSNVVVIGDGRLAQEMASLAEQAGHSVVAFLYRGIDRNTQIAQLPEFLREMADQVEIIIEAIIASRQEKKKAISYLNHHFVGSNEPILSAALNASATEAGSWSMYTPIVVGWAAIPPLAESEVFELMPGMQSAPNSVASARDFLASLGKDPVLVEDTVGGVLPRIIANLVNEAAFALTEKAANAEDIDTAMKLGTNYPHGPLAWGDLIGLDQIAGILTALGEAYGPDRYRLAPRLAQLVQAGNWGKESGQGFYNYSEE